MDNQPDICKALSAAQAEFATVTKDAANPFFHSNYATLKAIVDMVRPVLAKHGLGFWQSVDGEVLTTRIFHTSGQVIWSEVPFACVSKKPQDIGSAITYAKRYGLQAALGVVVAEDETDDDGNAANGNKAVKSAPKSAPTTDSDF